MQIDQKPTLVTLPFAVNGIRNEIPEESQAGVVAGAASLNDGFPSSTMLPKTQGGVPPDGKDFNGILFLLSAVARWTQAGGSFIYDPAFSTNTNLGGYPQGAVLLRADLSGFWFNLADSNTTDPDATDGSARNWLSLNPDWDAQSGPGMILNRPELAKVATSGDYNDLSNAPTSFVPVGTLLPFAGATVPSGFLLANGAAVSRMTFAALFAQIGTIYGAGDGATTFNLPDSRGVVLRGLDNGRGFDPGRALGSYQADSFASHGHGLNDPGHAHGVADPGHGHGANDPGHVHGWSDGSTQVYAYSSGGSGLSGGNTTNHGTSMLPAVTGISIAGSGTGIGIYGSGTGVSVQANGGPETRGKNVAVNYIIKY
ncbi:phage tail protein [Paraburkholderia youngii]|uniref:phage tail protein n=1 Tax=Paraburkholderia youngii TaxID=2782701 RepID=UPI003D25940F